MFYLVVIALSLASTVLCTSTESAHVHYSHNFDGCSLPKILPVTISVRGENFTSNLTQSEAVPSSFPVYTLSESGRGKSVLKLDTSQDKDGVAYQDKVALIAVVIKCREIDNNKTVLELQGTMSFHGKEFAIHKAHRLKRDAREEDDEEEDEEYTLEELEPLPQQASDAIKAPPSPTNAVMREVKVDAKRNILSRHKRDLVHYFVDIVMIVDYSIYRYWYLRSTAIDRRTDAIKNIRLYYAIVANGINLRYNNLEAEFGITVKLSGLVIAETTTTSGWTENLVERAVPRSQVNADSVLENLRDWVANTDSLPDYDHIMLFTRYDLYSQPLSIKYNSTAGLAYIGAVCDTSGHATSIVEDEGGYQSIETAAHELGHSLGARHDGKNPACSDADRYIMTQGATVFTEATQLNPWKFSKCSVDYFRSALKRIESTSRGYQCLSKTLSATNIPNVEFIMPGQISPPDETCRQIFGSSSRMCKGVEFGNVSQICVSLFCLDPTTTSSCIKQTAPRGTSCGDGKWCIDGQCVQDYKAPALDESCPFGDVSGIAFNGKTCESGVNDYPAYCYQEVIAGRCCSSCKKYYTGVYGCEYGDKGSGCVPQGCGLLDTNGGNYSTTCCGTCNYRIDSPQPTTPEPIPTTQPVCIDRSPSFLGGTTCQEFIALSREACYISSVLDNCCESCNRIKSQNYYCPYGDKSPVDCKARLEGGESCNTVEMAQECCESCVTTGQSGVRASLLTLLLVMAASVVSTSGSLL